jgi:DNA-directed RNA polymerase specialized sigma24 family protein
MQVATSYFQSNTDLSQHALAHHLAAAAGGDSQAFGQVVDATRNVVCSLALAVVRDVRVSEDVAQEVYLAFAHAPQSKQFFTLDSATHSAFEH